MSNAYCVETDGFYGELFRPAEDQYPGKALICFSGSDGGMELSAQLASVFCAQGLTALVRAYVASGAKTKRTPAKPAWIPLQKRLNLSPNGKCAGGGGSSEPEEPPPLLRVNIKGKTSG